MSDLLTHYFVALLVSLVLCAGSRWYVICLLPLVALIPDADHVTPFYARALLHNAFIPLGLFVASLLLYNYQIGASQILALASFFITVHILLDMTDTFGVKLRFPASTQNVVIRWYVRYKEMAPLMPQGVALGIIVALVIMLKK